MVIHTLMSRLRRSESSATRFLTRLPEEARLYPETRIFHRVHNVRRLERGVLMSDNTFERRTFMKRAGLMALAAAGGGRIADCYAQEQVKWSSGTDMPKLKAPANACDCHMHIYDARFPVDPSATLKPGDALVDDYRRLQKRIGT